MFSLWKLCLFFSYLLYGAYMGNKVINKALCGDQMRTMALIGLLYGDYMGKMFIVFIVWWLCTWEIWLLFSFQMVIIGNLVYVTAEDIYIYIYIYCESRSFPTSVLGYFNLLHHVMHVQETTGAVSCRHEAQGAIFTRKRGGWEKP